MLDQLGFHTIKINHPKVSLYIDTNPDNLTLTLQICMLSPTDEGTMTTQCPQCKAEDLDEVKFCNEYGLRIDSIDKIPPPSNQAIEALREELTIAAILAG